MALYIDDAFGDDDLTVRLTNNGIPIGQTQWKGILTEPLSFSATADFGAQGSGILDKLDDLLKAGGKILTLSGDEELREQGKATQETSLRIHKLTIKSWSGTEDPVINVSFAMVNSDTMKNVFEQYYDLYASMFAGLKESTEGGNGNESLIAPYGFQFDGSRNRNGTAGLWSVDVGRWFTAHNMILSNVELTSSLTLDVTPGDENPPMPMYAAVNCTFTTERAATQQMVRGWLRRNRSAT